MYEENCITQALHDITTAVHFGRVKILSTEQLWNKLCDLDENNISPIIFFSKFIKVIEKIKAKRPLVKTYHCLKYHLSTITCTK